MSNAPFPIDPHLTAIAIAYRNNRMIADDVLPRVPVMKQEFTYKKFDLADGFTVPDTKVGRKSEPNQVEFGFTEVPAFTEDYGLDDFLPARDEANAPADYDPEGHAVENLTNIIMLDREVRTAGLVFDGTNYASGNKVTLSGTDQWSDAGSDPMDDILTGLDAMVMRANIMVLGRAVFTKLMQHADIVKSFHGNEGDKGIATRQFIADLFELDAVYVGEGYVNSAKPGQATAISRVWGKHVSLIYRDELANADRGTTFGFTAEFGDPVAGRIDEPKRGLRGGVLVRSGESVKEVLTANDLGYFIEDAVA